MSLINESYFFGDLTVAQLSSVANELQWFIDERESELLEKLLGYQLHKDLIAGLSVDPVAQKWLDLVYGVEYTNLSGKLNKWAGLIESGSISSLGVTYLGDIEIIIDSSLAGLSSWAHPTAGFLTNKTFRVTRRAFDNLGSDVTIDTNGFSLKGESKFTLSDRYYIEFIGPVAVPVPSNPTESTAKLSLIANYVFWFYSQNHRTATTGTGEKQVAAANSINASAMDKEYKAWNKMVDKTRSLLCFLKAKSADYPQWDIETECACGDNPYHYKNSLGF